MDGPLPRSTISRVHTQQRQEIAAMDAEDRPDAVQQIWNQRAEAARQQHQADSHYLGI